MRQEIESFIDTILGEDWRSKGLNLLDAIMAWAKKAGRAAAHPILEVFYVLTDEETSPIDKALLYAALIYVAVPGDLLPRKIFKLLGIVDDAAALIFVLGKAKDKVTPEIELKVEQTLDRWFGMRATRQ